MDEEQDYPTALGAADRDSITLLGQDLAEDVMGRVGFGELAFWLATQRRPAPGQTRVFEAVLAALAVLLDILLLGRRQPMGVMEAVWPLTMLYWGPLGLVFYGWFGRARPQGEARGGDGAKGESRQTRRRRHWVEACDQVDCGLEREAC